MAATTASRPIDLSAASTWPVSLGASIAKKDRRSGYKSVQYNHYPKLIHTSHKQTHLTPTSSGNSCKARLEYGDQEFVYKGSTGATSGQYVLILGENPDAGARLERLDAVHVLNVIETPTEHDEAVLRRKYTQLDVQDDAYQFQEDEQGSDVLRTDNPFDYRHMLEDEEVLHGITASTTSTQSARPKSVTKAAPKSSTPSATGTSAGKKRKAVSEVESISSKRTKVDKVAAPVPSVRLSRKATLPPENKVEEDSGELVFEDDAPSHGGRKSQGSMALALSGQLGPGPISLHSAASSPASPFHSPAPERPTHFKDDDDSFELGGMSDGQDGGDEQEDGDVDDFELPSPVQDRRQPLPTNDVVEDDDDDLSKELARAMAEQEDEPTLGHRHQSEEESEEE